MEGRQPGKEMKFMGDTVSLVQLISDPMAPFLQLAIIITNNEGNSKEVPEEQTVIKNA